MQVGDAAVGVDHRQLRSLGDPGVDGSLDGVGLGHRGGGGQQRAEAVVGADVGGGEDVAELLEQRREERPHGVAEDDRVGHLHHRRLEVDGEQDVVGLGPGDLGGEELAQRGDVHHGGVDDLTGEHRHRLAQHGRRAVGGDELDAQAAVGVDDDRLLVGAEVVGRHVGDVGLGVRAPRTHRVRVLAGVLLHRVRRPAVRVALAQHRVDGRSLDPVVAGAHVAVLVGRRVVRVVREVVALRLQLGDRRLQLGDRRRDVGQLDDVGLGPGGQLAQLGQGVADALVVAQPLGEQRQDASGEGDVAGLDRHPGDPGVGLDDRQERIRRQQRRLIGVRVDDGG